MLHVRREFAKKRRKLARTLTDHQASQGSSHFSVPLRRTKNPFSGPLFSSKSVVKGTGFVGLAESGGTDVRWANVAEQVIATIIISVEVLMICPRFPIAFTTL